MPEGAGRALEPQSVQIGSAYRFFILMRFRHANRRPLRLKTL